jgi:hypothetical protein
MLKTTKISNFIIEIEENMLDPVWTKEMNFNYNKMSRNVLRIKNKRTIMKSLNEIFPIKYQNLHWN